MAFNLTPIDVELTPASKSKRENLFIEPLAGRKVGFKTFIPEEMLVSEGYTTEDGRAEYRAPIAHVQSAANTLDKDVIAYKAEMNGTHGLYIEIVKANDPRFKGRRHFGRRKAE